MCDQRSGALADSDCSRIGCVRDLSRFRQRAACDHRTAGHDLTCLHPDPDRSVPQLERGACRPQDVVFTRARNAEDGDGRVGADALDAAAMPLDDGSGARLPVRDASVQRLGVELLGALGELDRDDRRKLALDGARLGWNRRLVKGLVLAQDRLLERAQLGARLETELLSQRLARFAIHRERVGGPPAAVKGKHQLRSHLLPPRLGAGECLQLWNEIRVAPHGQVGFDPVL